MSEDLCSVRFLLHAEASPGLLPRVLEPFAKRDLVVDRVRATREGEAMRAELAIVMPEAMVHLVAGNLGQIIGVFSVELQRDERLAQAA
jgi:acetolactate synthase regulatory subunit